MTQKKQLTLNEIAVMEALSKFKVPAPISEIKVEGLKPLHVGKVAHNLQRMELTKFAKVDHVRVWSLTDLGRTTINAVYEGTQVGAPPIQQPVKRTRHPRPTRKISVGGTSMTPVDPQNLVYVVSEERLASILSARLGVGADEVKLLRTRVRTLEAVIAENAKTIDRLKRERDAALELAEKIELRIAELRKHMDAMNRI